LAPPFGHGSSFTLFLIGDQRHMKAISPGDQARRFLRADATLLGRERRAKRVGVLDLANLLALPLEELAKGLI
jgi:hypothetical protein